MFPPKLRQAVFNAGLFLNFCLLFVLYQSAMHQNSSCTESSAKSIITIPPIAAKPTVKRMKDGSFVCNENEQCRFRSQNQEDIELLEKYFTLGDGEYLTGGTVVEIGANDGHTCSNSFFFE